MIHTAHLHALVRRNLEHLPDFHAVRHNDLDAAVGENRALTAKALERGRKGCLGAHRFQLEKLAIGAPFLDEVRWRRFARCVESALHRRFLPRRAEDARKAADRYHWPLGSRESVRSSACAQAGPYRSLVRPEPKPWGRARSPGPTLPVVSCRENTSPPGDTALRLTPRRRKLRALAPSLEPREGRKSLPCSEQSGPRTFLR